MSQLPKWLSLYLDKSHGHDELADHSGLNPEHWDSLFTRLASLTDEDVTSRAIEIGQLLQNGNIKGSSEQQWHLDPLPFMLSSVDWKILEQGIKQRVCLLNEIQRDIYSEQKLLLSGLIRPENLYQDSHFMRENFSFPKDEVGLFFSAFDVYRTPSGEFKVLDDHCQCPLGLGLLLKSRMIARRVMAEEFAECNVQQIKAFLNLFQESINENTQSLDDPRVVILTQGIDDPNYNEHAFLSTYFGYTLVQSADLTVRQGEVWLKSLQGLGKINVILRWIPDNCIDSLEQTEYSLHGIAGLLQAVREGNVKVLNPFGSGVLSSAAVQVNLSKLCEKILNQPLLLTSPKVYKPSQVIEMDWGTLEVASYKNPELKLDGAIDTSKIKQLIQNHPNDYYFQEKPLFSSAPFWHDGELIAKPVIFRCYALSTAHGVEVLPSALCLSPKSKHTVNKSGWIKDTWIKTDSSIQHQDALSPATIRKIMDVTLLEGVISSRTAEHLFWLGRYLERCENTIRILRIFIDRYTELAIYPDLIRQNIVARFHTAIKSQGIVYPYIEAAAIAHPFEISDAKSTALALLADNQCAGSIINTLSYLANASVQVQELLSHDSRRIIDQINDQIKILNHITITVSTRAIQSILDKVISLIMAFNGSLADCMPNSNGWFLLEIGRRIERSFQITALGNTLLTNQLDEAEELGLLEAVLSSQVSLVTHKRRYRMYQSIGTGVELLFLDAEYPRSLLFQLEQINQLCQHLPNKRRPGVIAAHEKAILLSKTSCYVTEKDYLQAIDQNQRKHLIEFTHTIRINLDTFCDVLLLQYFSHTQTANKLNWTNIEQLQS